MVFFFRFIFIELQLKQDDTVESTNLALNNRGDNDTLVQSSCVVSNMNAEEKATNEVSINMDEEEPTASQPSIEVEEAIESPNLETTNPSSTNDDEDANVSTGN